MNIRPATSKDREAILALVPRLAATGTPPGRDTQQIEATDLQTIAEAIESRQPETQLLVAERDGSMLGLIHALPAPPGCRARFRRGRRPRRPSRKSGRERRWRLMEGNEHLVAPQWLATAALLHRTSKRLVSQY